MFWSFQLWINTIPNIQWMIYLPTFPIKLTNQMWVTIYSIHWVSGHLSLWLLDVKLKALQRWKWLVEQLFPLSGAQLPHPPPSLHKRHFYHATTSYKYLVSTIITIQSDLGRVCLTSSFVRWMFLDSKSLESSCAWRMWENQRIVIFFKAFLIQIQHLRDMMFFFLQGRPKGLPCVPRPWRHTSNSFMHLQCLDIWAVDLSPSNPY